MILKQTGQLAPSTQPWQLIRDAVADLELQEQTPGIVVDMDYWHQPTEDDSGCLQCLAGATISRRLGVDTEDFQVPHSFPQGRESAIACAGQIPLRLRAGGKRFAGVTYIGVGRSVCNPVQGRPRSVQT